MGKTLELFDVIGIWEPLKARLKLDLQLLKDMDYDDPIPESLRPRWINNLKTLNKARYLYCRRAIVPHDAVNPDDIELVVCSDAAMSMCGCAIYARFQLKNSRYSCQLLTARSKTTLGTIPRNELEGCALAAQTAFTVAKTFKEKITDVIFVSDSTISICWISNPESKLKQFVNARVKLIHRLVGYDRFYHIPGELNPADMLTRGDVECEDLGPNSRWHIGDAWMSAPFSEMPLKSYDDICSRLSESDREEIKKESHTINPAGHEFCQSLLEIEADTFLVSTSSSEGEICCDKDDPPQNCHCTHIACCCCLHPMSTGDMKDTRLPVFFDLSPRALHSMAGILTVQKKTATPPSPGQLDKCRDDRFLLDFVYHGFEKSFLCLAYVFRFIKQLRHRVHVKKKIVCDNCMICKADHKFKTSGLKKLSKNLYGRSESSEKPNTVFCSEMDLYLAWHFLCKKGSKEVYKAYEGNKKVLETYEEQDGVLFSGGRLSYITPIVDGNPEMPILHEIDYFQPVFLNTSSLTYALAMHIHWNICPHSGVERTMRALLQIIHVQKARKLVKYIRETCPRCRYLIKKHYTPATGNQAVFSFMKAPAFYATMMDIAGTFKAHDSVKMRVSKDAYFLVKVCLTTGAVLIGVLEDLSARSVILALTRFAARHGWPKYLLADNQSSFKMLENLTVMFQDLQGKLWKKQKLIMDFSTPLSHNEHGRVESKVKVLKEFLEKSSETGKRHSYLEWESIVLNISAAINSLPICHNQDDRQIDDMLGLITPNMFLLDRNNERSPAGLKQLFCNTIVCL